MSDPRTRHLQMEYLRPDELESIVRTRPTAYLPLGTLEFHAAHLPVGLDALNAHGVCLGAASQAGGVVLPPVYQGVGGGHTTYPWTIMMPSEDTVRADIESTLAGLERFGFRTGVLFTGHFADEQLAMVDAIAASWNADPARDLRVIATGVNRCPSSPLAADHAGVFETTLLFALHPELVRIDLLPSLEDRPSVDPGGDTSGVHRHDPGHPLWGVFGSDPRRFEPAAAAALLAAHVDWLAALAAATV